MEVEINRFIYILSKMVNQPTSMAEKEKREQLLSDEDFTKLYVEMINDFKKKKGASPY